ncbi:hypothetical protein Ae406Ps2_0504 [Pseudonocardia sp. Ae406_Ps2]|nr:hypothetical protein Ae406Ps2_0504 [Pseudonocardia sp. Ae406_Ps2]
MSEAATSPEGACDGDGDLRGAAEEPQLPVRESTAGIDYSRLRTCWIGDG